MPHGYLPFHMALSSMGLVFSNYESTLLVPNRITNEILTQAIRTVSEDLGRDPDLESRPDRLVHPAAGAKFDVRAHVSSFLFAAVVGLGVSDGSVQFSDLGLAGDYFAEAAGPRALVDGSRSGSEVLEKELKMMGVAGEDSTGLY
ncbi:MAG: hypothetical protein Q9173_004563 [Seirophora scorigena]